MKSKYYGLSGFLLYVASTYFFAYWYVNFYEPSEKMSYLSDVFVPVGITVCVSAVVALLVWLFKKNSYLDKFFWSLFSISIGMVGVNLLATYLMHWAVDQQS